MSQEIDKNKAIMKAINSFTKKVLKTSPDMHFTLLMIKNLSTKKMPDVFNTITDPRNQITMLSNCLVSAILTYATEDEAKEFKALMERVLAKTEEKLIKDEARA